MSLHKLRLLTLFVAGHCATYNSAIALNEQMYIALGGGGASSARQVTVLNQAGDSTAKFKPTSFAIIRGAWCCLIIKYLLAQLALQLSI
jgi:hypothetical protein